MKKASFIFILVAFQLNLTAYGQDADTVSLDQMIGQMVMVGLNKYQEPNNKKETLQAIREGKISGVVLFEKDLNKKDTKKNLSKLVWELQENTTIPLLIAIDEEGGRVNRLKPKYGFPKTVSAQYLGEIDNLDSTYFYASGTAQTLSQFGFNVNFAPTVDVNINPKNPVIGGVGRSYSSDYLEVIDHAQTVIKAHDAYTVATALKHFPGHGSSAEDTHLGIADVSNTWRLEELYPYKALIDSGYVRSIMSSHIVNRTLDDQLLPATLSKKILNGILRTYLGFDGVVFSDDMHMGAITQHYGFEEAVVLAVNAGVDVLVFSNNITLDDITNAGSLHALIKKGVEEGKIEEWRIRESYQRIMKFKRELGLLEDSYLKGLQETLKMN